MNQDKEKVKDAIGKQVAASIIGAFGVVVGLAWNTAITAAINEFFPAAKGGLIAEFGYALILTILVAVVAYYITKFFVREEKKEEQK